MSFWGNLFEDTKERRNASIFYYGLFLFFLGGVLIGLLKILNGLCYWPYILAAMSGMILFWLAKCLLQARARRLDRYKSMPLSRDELTKARSKLFRRPSTSLTVKKL
jgi:hypothetical protein